MFPEFVPDPQHQVIALTEDDLKETDLSMPSPVSPSATASDLPTAVVSPNTSVEQPFEVHPEALPAVPLQDNTVQMLTGLDATQLLAQLLPLVLDCELCL